MAYQPTNTHHQHYDKTTGELHSYPKGVTPYKAYYLRGRTEEWYVYEIIRLRQQNKRQRNKIKHLKSQQNVP